MRTWKYSTTDEYFDFLDFHDALVEKIQVMENQIVVDIESINILANHPLNPHAVAKNTDNCKLIFVNPMSSEATLFLEDKFPKKINCTEFKELEILKFTQSEQDDGVMYEIFGSDNDFCLWKVKAKSLVLYWNEFVGDAWFVDWGKE
ncbi:hypothetical protein [Paenibacillus herberti]|uniref:Uncharacterized protein n=1 Tax=Paenibacillus herberti TaxID=1619309 RepID=A0A229P284_9BACL|nr:hypothetical protein [Paenibacillus herberti]OXM16218.1 hypothetical protein CGZ75_05865 [Paenibacillus herberti]